MADHMRLSEVSARADEIAMMLLTQSLNSRLAGEQRPTVEAVAVTLGLNEFLQGGNAIIRASAVIGSLTGAAVGFLLLNDEDPREFLQGLAMHIATTGGTDA